MLKTVHVHTDIKFVVATNCFDKGLFDNIVVIIGDRKSYAGPYSDQAIFLSTSAHDLKRLITICSDADLVVFYDLDSVKSYVITRLPERVTIAWRFFGYELYKRRVEDYLSESTLALWRANRGKIGEALGRFRDYIARLRFGSSTEELFASAVKRADLFLGLSRYEYEHLTKHWNLPRFVQLPMMPRSIMERHVQNRGNSNIVLVGNSKSIYNNHLDIIDLICNSDHDSQVSFVFPFSYGPENYYTSEVRRRVKSASGRIQLLEDFLPFEAYYNLITSAKAAVFNNYRQMAMGNIFVLLEHGVKIYLNTTNIIYCWFIDLGFHVYTIEDFAFDLMSDADFKLAPELGLANAIIMQKLKSEFSRERFCNEIIALVNREEHE